MAETPTAKVPQIEFTETERNNMLAWLKRECGKGNSHALVAMGTFVQMATYVEVKKIEFENLKAEFEAYKDPGDRNY